MLFHSLSIETSTSQSQFLPELSHFDLQHNVCKQIVKIRLFSFENSKIVNYSQ